MQFVKYFGVAITICLVASVSSFASTKKDSGPLNIADNNVHVGSTTLAPGDYKVEWTGQGNHVNVNILKGSKVVASTQGKIVERPERASNNEVVIKTLKNKTKTLEEVDFNKRKEALVIQPSASGM